VGNLFIGIHRYEPIDYDRIFAEIRNQHAQTKLTISGYVSDLLKKWTPAATVAAVLEKHGKLDLALVANEATELVRLLRRELAEKIDHSFADKDADSIDDVTKSEQAPGDNK